MNQTKPAWQSTTIWGALLVIISTVNQLFQLRTGNVLVTNQELDLVINSVVALVGAGMAIRGRIKAVKVIK